MAVTLDYNSSSLKAGIAKMSEKLGAVVLMYCSTKAQQYEAYMHMNRPWTDRTGMAKATLSAKVSQPEQSIVRITLAHGVSYGIWLELAHSKNYAIVGPTIETKGPELISEFNDLMSKLNM